MNEIQNSHLARLLTEAVGSDRCRHLFSMIQVDPALTAPVDGLVPRAVVAQAMNMALFEDLLARVPDGASYVADRLAEAAPIVFDHGALRTVLGPKTGALPAGQAAFTRILEPLGYRMAGLYPLDRLGMTGRAYAHRDLPEAIAQFFVSELHPERFSPAFQAAVDRVVGNSKDPLDDAAKRRLARLAADGRLPFDEAAALVPALIACFDRQHGVPALADYQVLKAESAEMAWISTEGNAFNHATDRVADVEAVAAAQKALGRPTKDRVEVSASGRVRQTALRAVQVERPFRDADGRIVMHMVPGSFYEFISRDPLPEGGLDLGFDSANAQGIFKMTAAA